MKQIAKISLLIFSFSLVWSSARAGGTSNAAVPCLAPYCEFLKSSVGSNKPLDQGRKEFYEVVASTGDEADRISRLKMQIENDPQKKEALRATLNNLLNMIQTSSIFDFQWGVGATVGLNVPVGAQYSVEMLQIEKGELAFFCAPGVNLSGDLGLGVSASLIKPIGCKRNEDYTGNFFTVAGNFAPLPVLSFLGNASYSWGGNLDGFLNNLQEKIESHEFDPGPLAAELSILADWMDKEVRDRTVFFSLKKMTCQVLKMLPSQSLNDSVLKMCPRTADQEKDRRDVGTELTRSRMIDAATIVDRKDLQPKSLIELLVNSRFLRVYTPNLLALFESFEGTFSGCNSITVGGGVVSKGFIPYYPSASITHYTLAGKINFNQIGGLFQLWSLMEGQSSPTQTNSKTSVRGAIKSTYAGLISSLNMVKTIMTCTDSTRAILNDSLRLYRATNREHFQRVFPQNIPIPQY